MYWLDREELLPVSQPASFSASTAAALQGLQWKIVRASGSIACESVVVYPREKAPAQMPLLVVPHGGPHSAFTASWLLSIVYLAATKRAVLCANYTGSTGYDEAGVRALCGQVGRLDVDDTRALTLKAAEEFTGPRAVIGGSHGGFLGGHLIGQFPDLFATAVLRNPVLNLSSSTHHCLLISVVLIRTQCGLARTFPIGATVRRQQRTLLLRGSRPS